jgi:hypothetical protein
MKTIVITETSKDLKEDLRHTYLLSSDKSQLIGYIPRTEGGDFIFYDKPLRFDPRGRTFRRGF